VFVATSCSTQSFPALNTRRVAAAHDLRFFAEDGNVAAAGRKCRDASNGVRTKNRWQIVVDILLLAENRIIALTPAVFSTHFIVRKYARCSCSCLFFYARNEVVDIVNTSEFIGNLKLFVGFHG